MKIKIFILIIFSFVFLYPIPQTLNPTFAHLAGQPPFLEINNQYANLYPVPLTSLYNFDLPQDLAPENYLVNQSVNFELDKGRLPAPPDIVEKTKFDWDFTDGTHAQGLINQHKFSKIGSYIVKIYADDGTTPKPQIIESILINILPNLSYQLPHSNITINNQQSKDPLTDILKADFKSYISYDGSKSTSSSKITEYFWDFGDQKSSPGITQTHKYDQSLSQVFVVLRIKDSNGFIADNFIEIQNSLNEQNAMVTNSPNPMPQSKKPNQLPLTILGLIVIVGAIFMVRWWLRVHHHGSRL